MHIYLPLLLTKPLCLNRAKRTVVLKILNVNRGGKGLGQYPVQSF